MAIKLFDGDRPIPNKSQDRLGLNAVAMHLASAIANLSSPEGFVIGIEGPWGSGKSSLVNLALEELGRLDKPPQVVRFSPWLISSRDALLQELFLELIKVTKKSDLRHQLKKYARTLALLGKAATLAKETGLLGPVGGVVERGGEALADWAKGQSLADQKEDLSEELRGLQRKIVVVIDDLDRLEPSETGEVLRLVRAVADFPNIVYVLCYSREVLAQNLKIFFHLEGEKGAEFIDKIIQTSFEIPRPEAFQLRMMFRTLLESAFPQVFAEASDEEAADAATRLMAVIDEEGGRVLSTPRHVVRAINFLRLYLGPVLGKVDVSDMVWLQLIRLDHPELFHWIEEYMDELAAVVGGASMTEEAMSAQAESLLEALKDKTGRIREGRCDLLRSIVPGIKPVSPVGKQDKKWQLYENLRPENLAHYVARRRLGSPQHHRYYFALDRPSRSVSDDQMQSFLQACVSDVAQAAHQFEALARKRGPAGGTAVDALLDRLHGRGISLIPRSALPGLLEVLASGLDTAAKTEGRGQWGQTWVWNRASKVFEAAWPQLTAEGRATTLRAMTLAGGLGWLTHLFRNETFAHGLYGDRAKPPEQRLLTTAEFTRMRKLLVRRYAKLSASDLGTIPEPIHILYAWAQSGGSGDVAVKKWVARQSKRDEDFLILLESWRSWRATNDVVTYPLTRSVIGRFMNFTSAKKRLTLLSEGANSTLAARAKTLLHALVEDPTD